MLIDQQQNQQNQQQEVNQIHEPQMNYQPNAILPETVSAPIDVNFPQNFEINLETPTNSPLSQTSTNATTTTSFADLYNITSNYFSNLECQEQNLPLSPKSIPSLSPVPFNSQNVQNLTPIINQQTLQEPIQLLVNTETTNVPQVAQTQVPQQFIPKTLITDSGFREAHLSFFGEKSLATSTSSSAYNVQEQTRDPLLGTNMITQQIVSSSYIQKEIQMNPNNNSFPNIQNNQANSSIIDNPNQISQTTQNSYVSNLSTTNTENGKMINNSQTNLTLFDAMDLINVNDKCVDSAVSWLTFGNENKVENEDSILLESLFSCPTPSLVSDPLINNDYIVL